MTHRPRAAAIAGALIATLTLAACGGNDPAVSSGTGSNVPPAASGSTVSKEHNNSDVRFAHDMIVHHRGAIEMADLAASRAVSPEVKALAEQIRAAQQPEIDTMTGFLKTWGENLPPTDSANSGGMNDGGMNHDGMRAPMPGMMSPQQMQQLGQAQGVDFDRMFLQMMIEHHNGAIEMARAEQANGQNAATIALAKQIETTQAQEVQRMQQLLQTLA